MSNTDNWLDDAMGRYGRAAIKSNQDISHVAELGEAAEALKKEVEQALEKARIEGAKTIGYRLDNHVDFNQNGLVWETIHQYAKQLGQ